MTTKDIIERRKLALFQMEHFIRHALSGLIVFILAVTVDVFVTHWIVSRSLKKAVMPMQVPVLPSIPTILWPNGGTNTSQVSSLPKAGEKVELGFAEDGRVFWRKAN